VVDAVEDRAPLTLVAVVRGTAWIVPETDAAVELGTGDIAVIRGPEPYTVADDPRTPPQVVVHPGQRCTAPDGAELKDMTHMGVRTWGNSPEGETVLLTGTYQLDGEVSRRLLTSLPSLLVLERDAWDNPLVGYLAAEIGKDEPGQEAVLDRLLDLLLIGVLRAWFARPEAGRPAGTAPTPTRSSARRCACCTTARPGRGRSPRWPAKSACRAPRWPGGSRRWSASRR
jgi:hypothetical protein